jgi:hypothetical protein
MTQKEHRKRFRSTSVPNEARSPDPPKICAISCFGTEMCVSSYHRQNTITRTLGDLHVSTQHLLYDSTQFFSQSGTLQSKWSTFAPASVDIVDNSIEEG